MFRLINFENVEELNTILHQFMIMMTVCNGKKRKCITMGSRFNINLFK